MTKKIQPRPFLKWVGGKTKLLNELAMRVPMNIGVYHEPFVGGGALFFHLYREGRIKRAILSDLNAELIDTYRAVRDEVEGVIECLNEFPCNEEAYYVIRGRDPWGMGIIERAARMIYLNKTGYNGLYRVNRRGEFNVPFGRKYLEKYVDEENLRAVSLALRGVEIECESFEGVVKRAKVGDFVYFDPPYASASGVLGFTSYIAGGFGGLEQERLRDVALQLSRSGVNVMLSNSDVGLIHDLYGGDDFIIDKILGNRSISCDGTKRGKVIELIITNRRREAQNNEF